MFEKKTKSRRPYGTVFATSTVWEFTGLCWLMSAEPQPPKQLAVPTIEEIIFSEEFMSFPTDNEQIEYLKSKVAVDLDTSAEDTRLLGVQGLPPPPKKN